MAKILIIEDSPVNMKLACFLLQKFGHTVVSAGDAENGLTLAREEKPDLILMDIHLPHMDGLTATTLLKRDSLTATIPIIAVTALAMTFDHEKIISAGCDAYIAKPLRYKELISTISRYVRNDVGCVAQLAF